MNLRTDMMLRAAAHTDTHTHTHTHIHTHNSRKSADVSIYTPTDTLIYNML